MKKLIIIGAGGMGRTLYDMAQESIGYKTEFVIKGFMYEPDFGEGWRIYSFDS